MGIGVHLASEYRIVCSKLFVFGLMFSSNIFASLYTTVIILLYCCVIKCSKCCINMVYCQVITLLLTKYLTSAEMLVCAAGCVVKHLFACSSVSFLSSLSILLATLGAPSVASTVLLYSICKFPGNLAANPLIGFMHGMGKTALSSNKYDIFLFFCPLLYTVEV